MPTVAQHRASPELVRLLDLEPELASRLREDDRAEAREHLLLAIAELPVGEWSPASVDAAPHPFGLVVVDGLLLQEVQLAGRRSHQLLGPGDIVLPCRPSREPLAVDMRLVAAVPTRVALLDDRLQRPFALWPGLALGLLERAGRQQTRSAVQGAIAQLPRVEDRLEAMFWDLAERWGKVTTTGIHIPLHLSHETLARIVGGRRPTISLALTALVERGVLGLRDDGTWVLLEPAPTLARNDPLVAPPTITLPAVVEPELPAYRPWPADARNELATTTKLASVEYDLSVSRASSSRRRYEATRDRSRTLRRQAAEQRATRAAGQDRLLIPRRAPAAP